jgi:hypothetical protein
MSHFYEVPKYFPPFNSPLLDYSIGKINLKSVRVPFSSASACFYTTPTHLHVRARPAPDTAPPMLTAGTHLSNPSSPKSPSPAPARVCSCHLESLHRLWCAAASHHRCPPAPPLTVTALVGFQNRPLGDEALAQHALLVERPLPKACHGGRRLALPTHAHSHVGRVRWHPPLRHVAHLIINALSTSSHPATTGQSLPRGAPT